MVVTDYDGKKKENIRQEKMLTFRSRNSILMHSPNYILLDSRGGNDNDLRPHILAAPRGHNLDKDAFVEFLKQGLEEYKKRGNN